MLAYTLKNVIELIPAAAGHVKQASIDQDYPVDNPGSTIASALSIQYHQHVDGKSVDLDAIEKVAQAVDLYGVRDTVNSLTDSMVHAHISSAVREHHDAGQAYQVKVAGFLGDMSGFSSIEDLESQADALYKEAKDSGLDVPEQVARYSAHAYMSKKAAVESLAARYQASGEIGFAKLAMAIGRMGDAIVKSETVKDICRTVTGMDKQANLHLKGFDFYRETLLTKEAELVSVLRVRLAGQEIPYESLARVGKDTISRYIGEDVAKEMDGGPANFKQAVEVLPLDLQRLLLDLTKNA